MAMVYLKKRASNDLARLIIRLMKPAVSFVPLTREQAHDYVDQIVEKCYGLADTAIRTKTTYEDHKKFGKYVFRFDKHSHIQWYIIYDLDKYGNVVVKKIMSNNRTRSKHPLHK